MRYRDVGVQSAVKRVCKRSKGYVNASDKPMQDAAATCDLMKKSRPPYLLGWYGIM